MTTERAEVFFSGHVQGVGFRYTARELAAGFDVVGTVENLADGRVRLLVEGSRSEIEAFVAAIQEGPLSSHIRQTQVVWHKPEGGFKGFKIVEGRGH